MKVLADFIIAFFDLLEAEGRTLRRAVMQVVLCMVLLLIAALLSLAAAGFFLVGMYQYLSLYIAPPFAALVLACVSLLLGLIVAGIAHWRTR